MLEERVAVVFVEELPAIKDSRDRDLSIFFAKRNDGGDVAWVVAATEHQAKMALIDYVWPMTKYTKKERDERYTRLLEIEVSKPVVLNVVSSQG